MTAEQAPRQNEGPWLVEVDGAQFAAALGAAEEERLRTVVEAEDRPLREAAGVVVRLPRNTCRQSISSSALLCLTVGWRMW